MNAPESRIEIPTIIGTPTKLGIYFGRICAGGTTYALFQPPKAIAEHALAPWNETDKRIEEAYSFSDGHANTVAMAKAGSKPAQWALDNDMYIPSLDESDLQYRAFKPGTTANHCWMRSGINLSAETPLHPYTPDFPKQTDLEAFRSGGAEAFAEKWYWTSTEHRATSDSAWVQDFGNGLQLNSLKDLEFPVRAVRRVLVQQLGR